MIKEVMPSLTHSKYGWKADLIRTLWICFLDRGGQESTKVLPDDHSKLVPLLPIPNRTVKRLSADDSAGSRVKVGHRQASNSPKRLTDRWGVFFRRRQKSSKENAKAWYNRRLRWSQRSKIRWWELPGFFKNIQPISVGVWWWLPSSSELSFN